jgi:hypothetical protein
MSCGSCKEKCGAGLSQYPIGKLGHFKPRGDWDIDPPKLPLPFELRDEVPEVRVFHLEMLRCDNYVERKYLQTSRAAVHPKPLKSLNMWPDRRQPDSASSQDSTFDAQTFLRESH